MSETIERALARGHTIDITTIGRASGLPRRIEIYFENIGGRIYISGMPNPDKRRHWLRNLDANPAFTFHLKGDVTADLAASARVIEDPDERRELLTRFAQTWNYPFEPMVLHSPLIEVIFDQDVTAAA